MAISHVATLAKVTSTKVNQIVDEVNGLTTGYQAISAVPVGVTATNVGSSQPITAVSYASVLEIVFVGIAVNAATSTRSMASTSTFSGTGVTVLAADGLAQNLPATTTVPITMRWLISVPASTAVSAQIILAINTSSTVTLTGGFTYRQFPQ